MLLSEQAYQEIDRELAKYPADKRISAVKAALRVAQEEKGWVSPEIVAHIAEYIGVEPIAVQEVATFYNMYNLQPVGRYKLSVCTNLPCALRNGASAAEYLSKKLGIELGQTTPDGLITLEQSECQGACGDSPVMLINDLHQCVRMSEEKLDELIKDIQNEAKAS
ncbi:NADH-quinone oxidoreductase subunit NuoE [Brackiella oedipodis]|uniref:NADH-quinone oxidoreductase subunit NuoE n=1 Tax=Brackiella oedipodis TaxID=124225 RepID=UPI00048C8FA5|nr:NADH-quinone oxidoreductase subunit NuoE [Brackiella oedipodis]